MSTLTSLVTVKKTFTSATVGEPLALVKIPFYSCNFYVATNGCFYGDGASQDLYVPANAYFDARNGNLSDFFFINDGVGNTDITAVATVPTEYVKKALELL